MERHGFCLLCFKQKLQSISDDDSSGGASAAASPGIGKNIFSRFVKHILGQRLAQDIPNLMEDPLTDVCDSCESVAGKYCDLYFELESVHMRLRWQLERLKLVMKHAGKVPSRVAKFKEMALVTGNSESLDSVLSFRQIIYGKCSSRCKLKNPMVQLKRLNHTNIQLSSRVEAAAEIIHSPDREDGDDEIKTEEEYISNTTITNVETEILKQICILQLKGEIEDLDDRNNPDDSCADETFETNSEFCVETPPKEEGSISLKQIENEEPNKALMGSSATQPSLASPVSLLGELSTNEKPSKRSLREKFKCTNCSKLFATMLKLKDHETKGNCMGPYEDYNDDMIETDSGMDKFSNAKMGSTEDDDFNEKLNHSSVSSEVSSSSSNSDEECINDVIIKSNTKRTKPKEKFLCSTDDCTRVFSRQYLLDRHVKLHGSFSCNSCNFKTDNADYIFDHEISQHMKKPKEKASKIGCPRCPRLFCRVTRTKRHFFGEHLHIHVDKPLFKEKVPSGNFPCSTLNCKKVFKKKIHLDLHAKLHGDFSCNFCDLKTDAADNLLDHEWTEHSTKQEGSSKMKCSRCPVYFSMEACHQTKRLQHFFRKHLGIEYSGERKCPICGVGFAPDRADRRIRQHIQKVHDTTGMDPESIFKCDICNAPFRSDISLMVHKVRVHKQSHLECTICERKFYRQRSLVIHMKRLHGKATLDSPNILYCPLPECEKKFFAKFSLECHMRKHQKGMLVCSVCDKRCMNANGLKMHMKMHAIPKEAVKKRFSCVCDLCGKMVSGHRKSDAEQRLKTHLESKMHSVDRPEGLSETWKYSCEVCGKLCQNTFKLEEHMRIHLKEKPFICAVCGRNFSIKFNLKRHMKLVHKQEMPTEQRGRKRTKLTSDKYEIS